MKHFGRGFPWLAILVCWAVGAHAQSTANQVVLGYLTNSGCPAGQSVCWKPYGASVPITGGSAGSGPYVYTPLGDQFLTSLATATPVVAPAGSTICFFVVEGQNVRWRDDGTAPTATVGMLVQVGQPFSYSGNLGAIQFIQTAASATIDVACYR